MVKGSSLPVRREDVGPHWELKIQVYKLADHLVMPGLQNCLVTQELARLKKGWITHWQLSLVLRFHRQELTHTPYYDLALWIIVANLRTSPLTDNIFDRLLAMMDQFPQAKNDVLSYMNKFNRSHPQFNRRNWSRFLEGLGAFHGPTQPARCPSPPIVDDDV